ncbi:hypothetical protein CRUP_036996, partial [Coryphaenoides rupestris]
MFAPLLSLLQCARTPRVIVIGATKTRRIIPYSPFPSPFPFPGALCREACLLLLLLLAPIRPITPGSWFEVEVVVVVVVAVVVVMAEGRWGGDGGGGGSGGRTDGSMEPSLPPVQKLVVPVAAAVSGNRSVSFRPSLTPGGAGRFLDRTFRDTPIRQSPHLPEAGPGSSQSTTNCSSPAYPLSSTPAVSSSAGGSGGGKMKRERTTTRPSSKRPEDDEVVEVPDLPAAALSVGAFSLPTFSFSAPPPTTSVTAKPRPSIPAPASPPTAATKETVADTELSAASTPPCLPFTFSSPIVMATATSPPSFSPSAGFTFSAPVAKMGSSMRMQMGAPAWVKAGGWEKVKPLPGAVCWAATEGAGDAPPPNANTP